MKKTLNPKQTSDGDSYVIDVPIRIIYRLASDNSIIEEEEGAQPIEVDDRLIAMTEIASIRSGQPIEKIVLDFITEIVAKRLANEPEKRSSLEALANKYHCNILTEVTLKGKVTWGNPAI
jgi:hypothetical protein